MVNDINQTLAERGKVHGDWTLDAETADELIRDLEAHGEWKIKLTPSQRHALRMICSKMARIIAGDPNEPDHWHDIAGYATLAAKALEP